MKHKVILVFMLVLFASSCTTLKKGLGVEKDKPNEFLIEKRDPIILPPNYKILPPNSKTVNENKGADNSLKSVLDNSMSKNTETTGNVNSGASTIEQEIINQIK